LQASDYESSFSQIYFDAKIAWKRQEGKDEKKLQRKEEENDDNADVEADDNTTGSGLDDYAILLEPFYGRNPTIPHFFDKLLQSRDVQLRTNTALLLLRRHREVKDSILLALAANDASRSSLYQGLADIGQADRFPKRYETQQDIARSLLVAAHGTDSLAAISFIGKAPAQFKQLKGTVYFFTYKISKEDDWMIGLSGIQPADQKKINTDGNLTVLTGKKIRTDTPILQQCQQQWRRLLLARRKSAANFFGDNDYAIHQDED
jgi:hypothetical protein